MRKLYGMREFREKGAGMRNFREKGAGMQDFREKRREMRDQDPPSPRSRPSIIVSHNTRREGFEEGKMCCEALFSCA